MIHFATIATGLRRRIKTVDFVYDLSLRRCNIGKDVHELGACQVADLATPQGLHPFHVQVFKEEIIVAIRESMGELKKEVSATINNVLIESGNSILGFLPIVRAFAFTRHSALSMFQVGQGLPIVQRAFNLFSVRCDKKCFQTKIETCAVTCHGSITLVWFDFYHKVEIEIAKRITFNCDRLNARWNIARFTKLIDAALNFDTIRVEQLPTRLFQCEGGILFNFLESGRACANLAFEVAKEQLIGFVDAVNNVLDGLGTNKIPVREAVKLFQLGQMLHQLEFVDSLAKQTVVPLVKCDAMVINQPGNVNLLVQVFVFLAAVQFEFVRFDHH